MMIGKTISHYKILEKLGEGGMGAVYKAEDTRLKRTIALKFLPRELTRDPEAKQRFIQEAQTASALEHTNVCSIHEINETEDGRIFIVMACYEGESLKKRLERGPLKLKEAIDIATQVALGLAQAHKQGIVHRDIKPANTLVTNDGVVKIVDFGLAKLAGQTRLTRTGTTIGTMAYMSPEQARGEDVDHRTDIWSFGVMLYEMLTGQLPFKGEHDQAMIYSILNDKLQAPKNLRSDIPEELERIIVRTLEKDKEQRFQSANEVLQHLEKLYGERTVAGTKVVDLKVLQRILKKPRIAIPVLVILFSIVAFIFYLYQHRMELQHAQASLPGIEKLMKEEKYLEAYDLAARVEKYLKDNPKLKQMMPMISDKLSVITQPEGADVYLKRLAPLEKGEQQKQYVGVTPISDLRIPRVDHIIILQKEDYAPMERLASSRLSRMEEWAFGLPVGSIKFDVHLIESEKIPEDMVFVPGGSYKLVGWGTPSDAEVQLDDYFMDKYEVSNREYKEFIHAGGYLKREYWKYPFIKEGKELTWEEAMRFFKDRTGLPGPRNWISQDPPEGKLDHPVTDITWYEAAAFAEFAGKSLPTIFQWEKAAREGAFAHVGGLVMPWGLVGSKESYDHRANFEGHCPEPVDSYEFGISPYGCYNMAGNVKEWCLNEMTGGYSTTGGSWEDPAYMFASYGVFPGCYSSSSLGFRCVRNIYDTSGDQGAMSMTLETQIPTYHPVDEKTFRIFLSHYQYDKRPLDVQLVEATETTDWTREKVTFTGVNGDRIIAYLYLPKQAAKPYQCLNFIPGDNVFYGSTIPDNVEWLLAPHIKTGRAVLAVVPKGAVEREWGPDYNAPEVHSVRYREETILYATEFSLGLDYLSTREDIDMDKIAYVGLSWGAVDGAIYTSVDNRYRSAIFIGGGILKEYDLPKLPEANFINFAPRIKCPVLLLNGKYDEVCPYEITARPYYNLLPEPKQLALLEGGHCPPLEVRIPVINKWLDETLGPVKYENQ
jgi:serine/threonine protein kinase/formylglycine-generating enzyme required for sulfatase activity/cephalosporin-C deacetylase-like acetyl esterase